MNATSYRCCWQNGEVDKRARHICPISSIMLFCKSKECHPLWIKDLNWFFFSCLSWAQCRCAQVKGKKSFVFHSVNKHSTLNISCSGTLQAHCADVRPSHAELEAAFHFGVCGGINSHTTSTRPRLFRTSLTRTCLESASTLRIDSLTRLCVCLLIN